MNYEDEQPRRKRDDAPQMELPRDPFSEVLREMGDNPAAVKAQTRIDVVSHYGHMTTWNIDLFRTHKGVTALVQVIGTDGIPARFVIPPQVTSALARHQSGLISKARSRSGKLVAAKRRAEGLPVGNPEALAEARRNRAIVQKARRHK